MPMDPFATLGLPPRYDIDRALLDRRYRELQQALHPDRHAAATASTRTLTLSKAVSVNDAYRVLRDDIKRAEALLHVLAAQTQSGEPAERAEQAEPELLMEMMELREALMEARVERNASEVARLSGVVGEKANLTARELAETFAEIESAARPAQTALSTAHKLLGRLRYYRRFQDEVAQFEDEALT